MISISDFSLCRVVQVSFVISFLSLATCTAAAVDRAPVKLYFLMSVSGRSPIANRTAPAVSAALEDIEDREILPRFSLDWEIVYYDRCDTTKTLSLFIENREKFKTAALIAGGYCTSVCNKLCELTAAMNVTYLGIFCAMDDTVPRKYPNYMFAGVWISGMVPVYVELMKKFGWRRAVVLTTVEKSNYWIAWKIREEIQRRVRNCSITIVFCHNLDTEHDYYKDTKRILAELKRQARS